MRALISIAIAAATILLLLPASLVRSSLPVSRLHLERAIPPSLRLDFEILRARDRARHARILQGVIGGFVDFPVQGTSDPNIFGYGNYASSNWVPASLSCSSFIPSVNDLALGCVMTYPSLASLLYFTKVKLGSPPREFVVQIDTGSDVLWVNCNTCDNCPRSSALGIELNFFDTTISSTSLLLPCSDPVCISEMQTAATECPPQSNQCSYSFQYGDLSGTSGYYVSDKLHLDVILEQSTMANSSASIVFGCSTHQSGSLTSSGNAIDGIFGFGPGALSVISQLSSRAITPRVFSHCLKGGANGGGILVLGEILEPSIVYSPLVPSQAHYYLNLQSIAVNGQLLPINPAVLATSNNGGTIVDTGTTLAYLIQEAFDPFVNAITNSVSQSARPIISKGTQCYLVSSSISELFPLVSLNFDGGASIVLKPEEYLVDNGFLDGTAKWCMGFQKAQEGVTILGDLILKDKIFVYDLARQRIGWANYDCSSDVNVSATPSKDNFYHTGQLTVSSSEIHNLGNLLPVILSIHILTLMRFVFVT